MRVLIPLLLLAALAPPSLAQNRCAEFGIINPVGGPTGYDWRDNRGGVKTCSRQGRIAHVVWSRMREATGSVGGAAR